MMDFDTWWDDHSPDPITKNSLAYSHCRSAWLSACKQLQADHLATIATLTAERDALVEAIDAFNHIDRSGRRDTADLEQLNDAVERCLRLIES